jgi:hypothetical protein
MENILLNPQTVSQVQEAIKTLNLNLNSQTAADAAKWISIYLMSKELLIFLGKISAYVFIGWLVLKVLAWLAGTIRDYVVSTEKSRILKAQLQYRQKILEQIDWGEMKESLDCWYNSHRISKK